MYLNDMKTKRYICSELCHSCTTQTTCTFVGYVEDEDWDCGDKPNHDCNCSCKPNHNCNCGCKPDYEFDCGCNNDCEFDCGCNNDCEFDCGCNNDCEFDCGCNNDNNCVVCCYTTQRKPKPKPKPKPARKCYTTKTCCYKKCYSGDCSNNCRYACDNYNCNGGYNCVNICC